MRRFPFAFLAIWFAVVFALVGGGSALLAPRAMHPLLLPAGMAQTSVPLLDDLTAHETAWRASDITSYQIVVYHTNFLNDNQTETITVPDAAVVNWR